MFEDIQKQRQAVRENIEKSLQIGYTESEDFEKAHKVGDVHPNGKWVWTQLPSGKFDWRVIKVKPQANTSGGSGIMGKTAPKFAVQNNPSLSAKQQAIQQQMATQSQKTTPKSSVVGAQTFEDVLAAYQKGGINAVQTFDGKAYDLFEYEKQKKMALSVDESARNFGKSLVENNIKDTQKTIDDTKKNHPGATATMAKLNQQMAKFNAQLKAIEDAEGELKTSVKKNPAELKTISEVEDYAKGIDGVTFKTIKSGWSDKSAKAFELTFPHGGKMMIDFLHDGEYVYELTDSKGNTVISTNATDETTRTDWSFRLNPDKIVSRRIEVLKTKLTKLKGEETKARNKAMRSYNSYTDQYNYKRASEAVSGMKTKIQKLQNLIGTF